jgi:hypothetical protein
MSDNPVKNSIKCFPPSSILLGKVEGCARGSGRAVERALPLAVHRVTERKNKISSERVTQRKTKTTEKNIKPKENPKQKKEFPLQHVIIKIETIYKKETYYKKL